MSAVAARASTSDRMSEFQDHFSLFGLPRRYAVDGADLERRYRDLQSQVHPDKYAHLSDAERRRSLQWATQVNQAYQTLKVPLGRGRYLLELAGHDPQIEQNTAMPAEFLVRQMELREAVAEARSDENVDGLEKIRDTIKCETSNQFRTLQHFLDDSHDYESAAELVRRLMFQDKLLHEIDDALEAIEA